MTARFWILYWVAFFALRLPFLFGGYGADTDAYRVVLSARYLWSTGEYLPSRLPGYPAHELLTALLIWGGPLLTNLATVLAAAAGVLLFDRIVVRLGVPHRRWLLVAIGFTPWLVVTSTATLDYHFALTAMLAAYAALLRRESRVQSPESAPRQGRVQSPESRVQSQKPAGSGFLTLDSGLWTGGLALGVGVGFRITAGAFLLPLLVLVWRDGRYRSNGERLRACALLAGSAAIVSLLLYLPVLRIYGARFWNYADSRVSPDIVIQMVGQWALGAVGALVTIIVVAASWRRLPLLLRLLRTDANVQVWALTVLIYALIFLRLRVDIGYLVPIYPFAFLLVARVLARWALPVIVVAALLSGVVDLDIQGVHNFSPSIAARALRPSWRVAGFAHDWRTRTRWRRYAERILDEPVPSHTVVLTGGAFPDVAVLGWERLRYAIVERDLSAVSMLSDNGSMTDDSRDVVYLAVSEPRIVERLRAQGYTVLRAEPVGADWRVALRPVP